MQADTIISPFCRNETIRLSNGETVEVPEGADPTAFKRFEEAKLRRATNPKKSPKKSSSRPRRRTLRTSVPFAPSSAERQTQRTGRATAELTRRVNEAADSETSAILLNICGQFRILEVR